MAGELWRSLNLPARKVRLYMRPSTRSGCWQEQALSAGIDQGKGKSVQLSEKPGVEHFFSRTDAATTVSEQQQESVAIARGEKQIVQCHDHSCMPIARFACETLQQSHLVRQVKMLQRFVEQINQRLLCEQCSGACALDFH